MNESLNLEWLASQLWINASYLSRLFSEEVGQSITSYISNYRIEQAKKLIVESNLKLYEIAARTGFSSPIVFSTSFKK
ncbi:MAG: helix-turn-helix transcriptional regulator, partial [Ruthenibacterium sp.]